MKVVKGYFNVVKLFFVEIILFILNLTLYLKQFLKGLRTFSKSYNDILKGLEEVQKIRKDNAGEMSTEVTANWANEEIRLKNEMEKMFNQLFKPGK